MLFLAKQRKAVVDFTSIYSTNTVPRPRFTKITSHSRRRWLRPLNGMLIQFENAVEAPIAAGNANAD